MNQTEHLLTILSEEAAEVTHRACKAARFGLTDIDPVRKETATRLLEQEMGDLMAVFEMLGLRIHEDDKDAKMAKVKKYMDYARKRGTLEAETHS